MVHICSYSKVRIYVAISCELICVRMVRRCVVDPVTHVNTEALCIAVLIPYTYFMVTTRLLITQALAGEVEMSVELDELSKSLYNGHLPSIWRALAPSTLKSLGNWMIHFLRRNTQYQQWVSSRTLQLNMFLFLYYRLKMESHL